MPKTCIAAQLFTVREFLKTPEDIAISLKKVKDIGYDAVQVSGMGPIDPYELKKLVDEIGLEICVTHIPFPRLQSDLENVINEHKLWNCNHIGIGAMPPEYRSTKEGYEKFLPQLKEIADKIAESGLHFVYHNHSFEFVKFDGKLGYDMIFEHCGVNLDAEIDTFWVQKGGADPAEYIRKMKGRMDIIHLKDMAINDKNEQIMAEVGEGNLNWKSILEACEEIGIRWYVVEQDICQRDPFECLATSLKNLKAMGLK